MFGFYNFNLKFLPTFMVTSELKRMRFFTSGLKYIHFNFSNVNVYIFIIAVTSLKD